MNDIILMIVFSISALFILIAAIGMIRMPDFYLRISVTTKAATLGVGLSLMGMAMYFTETSVTTNAIAIFIFLFLTAPISGHIIGRASYFVGVKLWDKTSMDEIEGQYDHINHYLASGLEEEEEEESAPEK